MTKSHTDADFDKAMQEQGVPEVGFGNIKQEQGEPVAWFWKNVDADGYEWMHVADNQEDADKYLPNKVVPLYTTPQQRTAAEGEDTRRAWVGLSYEEAKEIYSCIHGYDAPKRISEAIEAKLKGEEHMIYTTFKQWVKGRFLETGEPRKQAYSKDELDLIEMGWNYGHDAGVQWQKSQQVLDKKADNARELGLDYGIKE